MMFRRWLGWLLILLTPPVWFAERVTGLFSTILGEWWCGARYMQPVDGITGDPSCGFNTDIHLSFVLAIVIFAGIVLLVSSKKEGSMVEEAVCAQHSVNDTKSNNRKEER
jgi:hypothetical protein